MGVRLSATAVTGAEPARVRNGGRLPGNELELSALTLDVSALARPAHRDRAVGVLRRAWSYGITTYDGSGASDPEAVEALLRSAFAESRREVVVLRGPPSRSGPFRRGPPRLSEEPLGTSRLDRPSSVRPSGFRYLDEVELEGRSRSGAGLGFTRCDDVDAIDRARSLPPPRLLAGRYSLVDRELAPRAARTLSDAPFAWIARNPFADGRLDGGRFGTGPGSPPAVAPRSLRELATDLEAISGFAFLAIPRRRTLAQAALRYLTGVPWVATVVIPLPAPERWDEIVGFEASPPLTDEERERVDAVTRPGGVGRPGGADVDRR